LSNVEGRFETLSTQAVTIRREYRLKIINAELRHPIGVDGDVRAPANSKLAREFENWTKASVGMTSNLVPFRSSRQAPERLLHEICSSEICSSNDLLKSVENLGP
jgi:hypothetical protein